jgi:predicted SprT family Zn-dependent metalloprotease
MFNPKLMSLQTIHHEVAHMICVALDKPVDHGIEFKKIMAKIWHYCSNIELYE